MTISRCMRETAARTQSSGDDTYVVVNWVRTVHRCVGLCVVGLLAWHIDRCSNKDMGRTDPDPCRDELDQTHETTSVTKLAVGAISTSVFFETRTIVIVGMNTKTTDSVSVNTSTGLVVVSQENGRRANLKLRQREDRRTQRQTDTDTDS